jgi:hypothetical protein
MSDVGSFQMTLLKPEDVDFFVDYEKAGQHSEADRKRYDQILARRIWGMSGGWFGSTLKELIDDARLDDSLRFLIGERHTVEQITGPAPGFSWTGRHRLARPDEEGDSGYHRQYTILPPRQAMEVLRGLEKLWQYARTQTGRGQMLWMPEGADGFFASLERARESFILDGHQFEPEDLFRVLYNLRGMLADAVRDRLTAVYLLDRFVYVVEIECAPSTL